MVAVNTRLLTRDGRHVGNAIVTGHVVEHGINFHEVKTDYGSQMRLTDREVSELYYIGSLADKSHKNYQEVEMKKFMQILIGLFGVLLYSLMFVVIVAIIEMGLYAVVVGLFLINWVSFNSNELPQMNTAMAFYSTMAVSVVLAGSVVFADYRNRKIARLLQTEPQPEESAQKSEGQES